MVSVQMLARWRFGFELFAEQGLIDFLHRLHRRLGIFPFMAEERLGKFPVGIRDRWSKARLSTSPHRRFDLNPVSPAVYQVEIYFMPVFFGWLFDVIWTRINV
jgi:hypothetical protein